MTENTNHSFNVEFASRYGIEESIIFGNIYYWCLHNKNNNTNLKNGKDGVNRYYTFNSVSALQQEYRYITLTKVYRVIEKLEKDGLIITGCFNKRVGDRTRWYAITEKGEQVFIECNQILPSTLYDIAQFSNCKLQNEMHNSQNDRHNLQNETTLPVINKTINTNANSSPTELEREPFPEPEDFPKSTNTPSKKTTCSKAPRKTEEQKHKEYLSTLTLYEGIKAADCVDLFIELHKKIDPLYNKDKARLKWQVDFAKFQKETQRPYEQILEVIKYAFNDEYRSPYLYTPENILNKFEDIVQKMSKTSSKSNCKKQGLGSVNYGNENYSENY